MSASQSAIPRVLVVDDEQDILVILSYLMTRAGYDVVTAANGRDALAAVNTGAIELVLLDYMLPDMNGLEILQRIKDSHPDTEVIIVTGRGSDRVQTDVMAAGAAGYVVKPFSNDMLIELARTTVEGRRERLGL